MISSLKVLSNKFLSKVAKIFGEFLGYFEKCDFLGKKYCGYFLGKLGYFYWSHWSQLRRIFPFILIDLQDELQITLEPTKKSSSKYNPNKN